jgi:methylaspartate ammonia-lyase
MTHITRILAVPATGAYYCEDLSALQANPTTVDQRYTARPTTAGFDVVRQVSEGISVGLVLDDDTVAWGDCVAVAYSGKAGRAPVLRAVEGLRAVQHVVAPALLGRELTSFRQLAAEVETLTASATLTRTISPPPAPEVEDASRRKLLSSVARLLSPYPDGEGQDAPVEKVLVERPLHTAVRYGVSQALLQGVALQRGLTMAEVIAQEWDLPRPDAPVPIHAQSGGERYRNADKMIVRRVASLPHALVDNIPEQLGEDGAKLVQYIHWLQGRIQELGPLRQAQDDYRPTIHLDVHGALGQIFENDLGKVLGQLYAMESAAAPYPLRVECPILMENRPAQIEALKELREYVRFRKMKVQLVADEWANTLDDIRAFIEAGAADMIQVKMPDLGGIHNSVEAVLACQAGGVGAFLGGSCAETDLAARVSVHVALATRPDIIMAKPGMGVDEGVSIVQNEMTRTLAWLRAQRDIGY